MELEERVYNDALNSGKEADDFYADWLLCINATMLFG